MDLNQKNRLRETVRYYQQILIEEPEHPIAYYNMGVALKELGEFEKAISVYKHQLKINPLHYKSWNNIGSTLTQLEIYEEAKKAFDKALKIDPIYLYALTNAAELSLIEADHDLCTYYVDEILKLVGDQADEFSVMAFFVWLNTDNASYQPVLDAIEKRDSKKEFKWSFETLRPVIEKLRKSKQKIAESFIRYFNNQLSFSGLDKRLKNE
jgi:tetratricopeptide (TPR) repeat protein